MGSGIVRKSLPLVVTLAMVALLVPFAQNAVANHGNRTMDAEPETNSQPAGETQVIVATMSAPADVGSGAINIDFELEEGQNNQDGDTPRFPDRTCSIPSGEDSCAVEYVGELPGTDTWRIWVDHDGQNSSTEADGDEGRNENADEGGFPGTGDLCVQILGAPSPEEPDCTDVVEYTWEGSVPPGMIDCDDSDGPDTERATNPSGGGGASNENVTCRVFDEHGNPINDADPNTTARESSTMYGENKNGPNDPDDGATYASPDYQCSTPTSGSGPFNQCGMNVTQAELQLGTAQVCFWAVGEEDANIGEAGQKHCETEGEPTGENQKEDGSDAPNDLGDQLEVSWEERVASGIDVETETETLAADADRTLTATVYDQYGNEFGAESTTVDFEFFADSSNDPNGDGGNTPGTPDASCETGNSSTCEITYTGDEGRDLICGWIGADPKLQGNAANASGTCDGEGRVDQGDDETTADPPEDADDNVDVVETIFEKTNSATTLECDPEWNKDLIETNHQVRCEVEVEEGSAKGFEIDVEMTGTDDPDSEDSRTSPDKGCLTNNQGACTINHRSSDPGKTFYTASVDADFDNATDEADGAEGRNEKKKAGDQPEPDTTDKVVQKWASGKRVVKVWKDAGWIESGEKVKFWANINANAGDVCKVGQKVKLKTRDAGSNERWRNRRKGTTDNQGRVEFGRLRIGSDSEFKAAAPKNGNCDHAVSKVKTVRTK